ncbi:hypothetical protein [Nocardiopsis sp. MG754419]|uniref:hypothetical protein n=1 Tax=Nocardiopsis sp. MG754419 TaxID=2259865 RepID=UPI001BA9BC7B|nr:hypothetical protein [Nocardiopsis sp. MG754419]MBR8741419.1 hypothetical protein [Nocardiopsis sp. MG754419]
MTSEKSPSPPVTPLWKPIRYRWILAIGLVTVLVLGWAVLGGDEEELDPHSATLLRELREHWPDPQHPEGMDDFLDDARSEVCPDVRSLCHVLWADSVEFRSGEYPHQEMSAVLISLDDEGQTQQTWVEWSYEAEEGEEDEEKTDVRGPFPFDQNVAAVRVRPVKEGHFDNVWLFPEGAADIEEIRYADGGVVTEELEQPEGDHFEHVRSVPRKWWARRESPGTRPLIRYRDGARNVYSVDEIARVCVGEWDRDCHTTLPTEETLVSLRPMWDSQYRSGWRSSDEFLLDDSLEIAPDLAGALDEPLSGGTGHVARISWTGPETEDGDGDGVPEQLITYAVYFDDGSPALLSAYRGPEKNPVTRSAQAGPPEGVDGITLFPYTSDEDSPLLVPVFFHPSGQRILLAPDVEEAGGGSGYTVYEPLDAEVPPSVAYVLTEGDGQPLATGWLDNGDLRP